MEKKNEKYQTAKNGYIDVNALVRLVEEQQGQSLALVLRQKRFDANNGSKLLPAMEQISAPK